MGCGASAPAPAVPATDAGSFANPVPADSQTSVAAGTVVAAPVTPAEATTTQRSSGVRVGADTAPVVGAGGSQRQRKASVEAEIEALDSLVSPIIEVEEVEGWLQGLGMEEHWAAFTRCGYEDFDSLREFVNEQVLREEVEITDEAHLKVLLEHIPTAGQELEEAEQEKEESEGDRQGIGMRDRRASAEAEIEALDAASTSEVQEILDDCDRRRGSRMSSASSHGSLEELAKLRARKSFTELPDVPAGIHLKMGGSGEDGEHPRFPAIGEETKQPLTTAVGAPVLSA
jgi:hypothetical protein